MLSIGVMAGGQGNYYQMLAREDYYLNGGEPPGRWWGATEALKLPKLVTADHLRNLFEGRGVDGQDLVQNAGSKVRRPGFDFTFSAPKSVSILWATATDELRRDIQAAQDSAVRRTLEYAQEFTAFTRTGKGGSERHRAKLVAALFEHSTSRAMDPQLHTHALLMNVGVTENGHTGALVAPRLFEAKMMLGALYRAELAAQLERRGVRIERDRFAFKVHSISQEACEHYSKRRADIEKELGARGLESAVAAAVAAKESREIKSVVPPRRELFQQWGKELQDRFHLTADTSMSLQGQVPQRNMRDARTEALSETLANLTSQQGHFTARDFTRRLAEASQGRGLDIDMIHELQGELFETAQCHAEREESALRYLGTDDVGERHFTTPQMQKLERALLDDAARLHTETDHGVSEAKIREVLDRYLGRRLASVDEIKHHAAQMVKALHGKKTEKVDRASIRRDAHLMLSVEQRDAIRYLTGKGHGSIRALEGAAGTGKTSTLRAAREIWESAGYQVIGTTVSGKARKELERGSGIASYTTEFLHIVMEKWVGTLLRHHGKQLKNLLAGKHVHDFKGFKFTNKHVLVIDEAGMVDTPQMVKFIKAISRAGGMVVMAFDRDQIQAIGPGGAAAALADRFGKAELHKIIRQRDARDVQVVRDMASGKSDTALASLNERGLVAVEKTRQDAIERLVGDWSKREKRKPIDSLIFAGTNADAQELNRLCQAVRKSARQLTGSGIKVTAAIDDQQVSVDLYKGDRVMFLKNNRRIGVNNGEIGTVIRIGNIPGFRTVTVRLDDADKVVIPLKDYQHMTLGYACTSHKGQGSTVERAYILAGGKMQDRQISHVQVSRARESTRIYADAREAGEDLNQLARQMARTSEKTLALTQQHHLVHRP